MRRIVVARTAAAGFDWFRRYYREPFPDGRESASTRVAAIAAILAEIPTSGRPHRGLGGQRVFPVRNTPFTIIYRYDEAELTILDLVDQRSLAGTAL